MKKSLLKATLICLGVTLLCGLYSFRTSENVKSQRSNRTASIIYDTIITSDEEESECIQEIVAERDEQMPPCSCKLEVRNNFNNTSWTLYIVYQSCGDGIVASAKYSYIIEYRDRPSDTIPGSRNLGIGDNYITSDSYENSICKPYSLNAWACEKHKKPNQNR